ncbi:MAG: hypothetical protein LJE93_08885 [Acidobacteria bacterium]|jgi:hypothetical protein|nr:hypothetical protein [Acidobacteriota bacterium]
MTGEKRRRQRDRLLDEELEKNETEPSRPRVDPDERDEYDEWRRERGSRGRKRKNKAGGRHRRRGSDDWF